MAWRSLRKRLRPYPVLSRPKVRPICATCTIPKKLPKVLAQYYLPFEEWRPPSRAAVYFLVDNGRVVYVGSTVDVNSRLKSHRSEGIISFSRAFFVPVQYDLREDIETLFIEFFNPPKNRICRSRTIRRELAVAYISELADMVQARERADAMSAERVKAGLGVPCP